MALGLLVYSSLALSAFAQKVESDDIPELKPQEKIERELKGGESFSYRIILTTGQYLRVVTEQKGVDLLIRLYGPDGQKLSEVDNFSMPGIESIFTVAGAPGAYRVEAQSTNKDVKPGTYEIRIAELREATSKDRSQMAAQKVFEEADRLRDQRTAESRRKAIEKYGEALLLWRNAEDRFGEANALRQIGSLYRDLSDNGKALEFFSQALPLYRALEYRQHEAGTLNAIGRIYRQAGETQKALDYYNQSLPLSRAAGDRNTESTTLSNIGLVYRVLGDPGKALEYFERGLSLKQELGDRQAAAYISVNIGSVYEGLGDYKKTLEYNALALPVARRIDDKTLEAVVLNNFGQAYQKLGELSKALEYLNQSLQISRTATDRFSESTALDNIAAVYELLNEPQKALENLDEALQIRRAINDRQGQGITLHNIGRIYMSLGEFDRALPYFEQSISVLQKVGARREEAGVLDSIGQLYFSLNEFQKALDHHNRSLSLRQAVGDRYGEAYAFINIGAAYNELGEPGKALEYSDQALKLSQSVGDRRAETLALHTIGRIYSKLGEADRALENYQQALAKSHSLGNQSEESLILLSIGRLERDRANLVEARRQVEAALSIIESTRTKVASRDLRSSYFASKEGYYKFYIDLLMQMHKKEPAAGHDITAFGASERARARSLLDLLTESRVDIRQGVDLALLDKGNALQQQLNARSEQLTRLLSGKHTDAQETAARKAVESVLADLQDIEAQIRTRSPRYAALTQPQPLSSNDIQRLLDPDTVLLEYALSEERSYAWAVTPDSVKSFELPKRAVIEAEARRVYGLLVNKSDDLYPAALADLSRMLLGPVADRLGRKRLLIVADGALQYMPFGALPVPTVNARSSAKVPYRPLILDHEVVSLPSASVVAVLRREVATRPPAPKKVAVLADPVFVKEDVRVKTRSEDRSAAGGNGTDKKTAAGPLVSDVKRSADDLGRAGFDRLPVSRREADLITALAPSGQSLKALDFAASRATATSAELSRYQIVHFATHGLLNNQHPELSGIVLSLVDERGEPQDGFLRLHEIYNLKLDADLVVLSACETALGKEIKGEGLIGLTRGFMYAGSPRVVASLWKVGDSATAELMQRFYRNMLSSGMRPAAALRAAQVSMWKERQWAAPFYWAGFVMQGEWR